MKRLYFLSVLILLGSQLPAHAQSGRELTEARALYQQTNSTAAAKLLRASLSQQANGFLGQGLFQFGALRTYDGHYRRVPGLRYHAGLRLLEVQDSINTDSTHLWPAGSLRGFDIGEAGDPDLPLRRFRTRLVKVGSEGTRREFVEVLTAIDAGPLLLAWLYSTGPETAPGRRPVVATLLAGSGTNGAEPLRLLEATQATVLRLFGGRANAVRTFAAAEHLDYTRPADIARMMDYYNRVAVIK
ncbi:MAG TPA: hypothetical protein VF630_11990 [Hymenobacter sp.]